MGKNRKKRIPEILRGTFFCGGVLAILLIFFVGLSNLDQGRGEEGLAQLESSLRQAAVACYAVEGVYPPDVAYLEKHYGIQIDREHYTVHYQVFGSNLMPDITVLEKEL